MNRQVLIVGSINQDVVIQMDKIPSPGETLFGKNLSYFPGGKGANQAVATKYLGGKVLFMGKVGEDIFGSNMVEYLTTVGLSEHIRMVANASTGTAVINVDKNGENAISVVSGANALFSDDDLFILDKLNPDDIILLQNEIDLPTIFLFIKEANKKNIKVFYNPAPAIKIPENTIPLCDCIIVNEHELEVSFGLSNTDFENEKLISETLLSLSEKHNTSIVLTLGAGGYIAVQNGAIYKESGISVKVVDTTGAGDCFCGALVAYISNGFSFQESLSCANKAAALSVTKAGASSSYPKIADIKS